MANTVIHCEKCHKPLMTQVAMAEGTRFIIRCFYCGAYIKIIVSFTAIHKRLLASLHDNAIIEREENSP